MGGSECQQSEQEDPVMSVTGEARVSEIMSLNIQVSSTGKTKIQQLLLGRVLESGRWSHPLFFLLLLFFLLVGEWVCVCIFPTTRPPS